jgi:nucleotide-binding universal stress UspA family protein
MAGEIVVGYDGSECAKAAVRFAADVANHYEVGLCIAFCAEPPAVFAGGAGDQERAIEAMGQGMLDDAEAIASGSGVAIVREMVNARPSEGLIAAADKYDARVIVVGNNGGAPLSSVILGATPHKLLHQSKRPVLVVPASE